MQFRNWCRPKRQAVSWFSSKENHTSRSLSGHRNCESALSRVRSVRSLDWAVLTTWKTTIGSRCGAGLHGRTDEHAGRSPIRIVGREIVPLATGPTRGKTEQSPAQGSVLPVEILLSKFWSKASPDRQMIAKRSVSRARRYLRRGLLALLTHLNFFAGPRCLRQNPGSEAQRE